MDTPLDHKRSVDLRKECDSQLLTWCPSDEATVKKYQTMRTRCIQLNDLDKDLYKVIHYAALKNDLEFLQKVVSFHKEKRPNQTIALINERYGTNQTSALMNAASGVTKYLLDEKADPGIKNIHGFGNSVYHWAVWHGDSAKLRILLHHNPNGSRSINKQKETPLKVLKFLMTDHECARAQKEKLESKLTLKVLFQQIEDVLKTAEGACGTQQSQDYSTAGPISISARRDKEYERHQNACTESEALFLAINRLIHGEWEIDSELYLKSICDKKLRDKLDADKIERQDIESKVTRLEEEINRLRLENRRLQQEIEALKAAGTKPDKQAPSKLSESEFRNLDRRCPELFEELPIEQSRSDVQCESQRDCVQRLRSYWQSMKDQMQRDILNSILQNLTDDLYSSRMHFVSEIIQNAVDSKATVLYIVLSDSSLSFGSIGEPVEAEGVKALCSIGASSKKGGYAIGQKGIGFKSVFSVAHFAIIRSAGMSFSLGCVDAEADEVARYLTPAWVDDEEMEEPFRIVESALRGHAKQSPAGIGKQDSKEFTFIHLSLKQEIQVESIRAKVKRVLEEGVSLLVLEGLSDVEIGTIKDGRFVPENSFRSRGMGPAGPLEDESVSISRTSCPQNILYECPPIVNESKFSATMSCFKSCVRSETVGSQESKNLIFHCVCANVDLKADNKTFRDRWRKDVMKTRIIFCFPELEKSNFRWDLPLYAFLPIENYKPVSGGLPFLFHADWILTSNREALKDNDQTAVGWNVLLRDISAVLLSSILKDPTLAFMTGVRGHFQQLFQHSGLNAWWECFLQNIIDFLNSDGNLNAFRVTDSILEDFEVLFPCLGEKFTQAGYIFFDDKKKSMKLIPRLSLRSMMQMFHSSDSEMWFSQCFSESTQLIFALMDKYLDDCSPEEIAQIRNALFTKPSFRGFPSSARTLLEFPHFCYLFSNDPQTYLEFSWPNQDNLACLSIPGLCVIYAEFSEEEKVLEKLGIKQCTFKNIVDQIQVHHAVFFGNPENQNLGIFHDSLEQHIWYLFQKRHNVHTFLANSGLPFPLLFIPVDSFVTVSPAQRAVLPSFLGLEISTRSELSCDHCIIARSLFRHFQNHNKLQNLRFKFELFLLEIGCLLPPEGSLVGSSSSKDSVFVAGCVDCTLQYIRLFGLDLNSAKLEQLTGVERTLEFVRILTCLKQKDGNAYLEVLRQCQSMKGARESKICSTHRNSRSRHLMEWDHLISKDVQEYRNRLERGCAAEDEAFEWLQKKISGISGRGSSSQVVFAEHNDDGYDIVVYGQCPKSKKSKCFVEVKGISKYSDTGFIYISRNEYLKMKQSLNHDSEFSYVVLIVDEVASDNGPSLRQGRVCGWCDAESLLFHLSGWAKTDVDYDVDSTEFRISLQTLKERRILSEPNHLFQESQKGDELHVDVSRENKFGSCVNTRVWVAAAAKSTVKTADTKTNQESSKQSKLKGNRLARASLLARPTAGEEEPVLDASGTSPKSSSGPASILEDTVYETAKGSTAGEEACCGYDGNQPAQHTVQPEDSEGWQPVKGKRRK